MGLAKMALVLFPPTMILQRTSTCSGGVSLHATPAINYPFIRIPDRFDASWPLVFTHGDLHLSNIRLGRDGKLYLIDWGLAGLYPQWFESWQMQYRLMIHAPYIPRSFVRFYWFMCGWYPRQARFMWSVRRGVAWTQQISWRYTSPHVKTDDLVVRLHALFRG